MAREMSNQAAAAKAIRSELKAAFPAVAFRVTSKGYSMGNHVSIGWTDGPSDAQVETIVGKYEMGHFDGMIDLYEYSNRRDDIPQTKYVFTRREVSREAYRAVVDYLNRRYGWALVVDEAAEYNRLASGDQHDPSCRGAWRSTEVNVVFHKTSLVCRCGAATTFGDNYCGSCGANLMGSEEVAA